MSDNKSFFKIFSIFVIVIFIFMYIVNVFCDIDIQYHKTTRNNSDVKKKIIQNRFSINFNGKPVMIALDKKNNPWFSISDIAHILSEKEEDLLLYIPDNEQAHIKYLTKSIFNNNELNDVYINIFGFYTLLFSTEIMNNETLTQEFKKWMFIEALPQIHRYTSIQHIEKHDKEISKLKHDIETLKTINELNFV